MIESHITYSDSFIVDKSLENEFEEGSREDLFNESLGKVIDDVIEKGYNPRLCCPRLSLQSSVTKTTIFTGSASSEDTIQRRRLVIKITALTGSATFQLQGCDTSAGTYENVGDPLVANAGEELPMELTTKLTSFYKFYKLNLTAIGTTVTYSAYLVESVFEEAHELRFFTLACDRLRFGRSDETFEVKYQDYKAKYDKKLNDLLFWYDRDGNGTLYPAKIGVE